jgi:uncharacterized protein (TIGR02996 family)
MEDLLDHLCAHIRAADLVARFSLDTTYRLVYADWIEQRGEPERATAVRLHVRLEHLGYPVLMPPERSPAPWMSTSAYGQIGSHLSLYKRLCCLWRRHRKEWLGQYPTSLRRYIRFRAGLPWVFVGPADLLPAQMRRELSLIRSWRLIAPPQSDKVAIRPVLQSAFEIEFSGPAWRERLPEWLIAGAVPESAVRVGIINGAMAAETVPLVLAQKWPSLLHLDVSGNALGADSVATIWTGLRDWPVVSIDLSRNAIGEGFGLFLEPGPSGLKHLYCAGNHAEEIGTGLMGNSMQMRRLTSINWMGNSLNQEGAEAIASWDAPMLRSLDLSDNHLGATGALHLRRYAWIKNLRHLNLAENNLREEGIGHLAPALGALLKTLALDSNLLEASSGQFLAESPARERLVILELSRNRIGNRGWELLSEKPWPKLRHLGLMLNDVGPDAPPPSRDKFPRLSGIRLARPPEDDSIAS